jgi:hypothetical protein
MKRNSVKRESAVFSFLTDGNSGVHKGVVCTALSQASDLGYFRKQSTSEPTKSVNWVAKRRKKY